MSTHMHCSQLLSRKSKKIGSVLENLTVILNKRSASGMSPVAVYHRTLGFCLQIESWLLKVLEQQPNNLALQVRMARLRAFQSRYDEAEALYARVLAADPYNAEAINNLAWHLIFRHHHGQEAVALVNRAIDVAGEISSILNTRALAFTDLGQSDPCLPTPNGSSRPSRPAPPPTCTSPGPT